MQIDHQLKDSEKVHVYVRILDIFLSIVNWFGDDKGRQNILSQKSI